MFNQKILAEQGEVFKAPNGQIQKISNNAPSHDDDKRINKFGINKVNKGDGGVEIDADSVLSDSYRQVENGNRKNNVKEQIVKIKPIEGESIAGQLGLDIRLKKAVSPSQLFLAIQKAKDKKTLSILGKNKNTTDTREGSNSNAVNASQLSTLPTDEEIYNAVFEHTEQKKEQSGIDFEEEAQAQYGGDNSLLNNLGLISKGQYGQSTYVQKPINPFQIQKNQRDVLEEEWKNRQTYLSPTKQKSPAVQQYYKNEQAKKEANGRINNRQNITNAVGMALAPVPVLGEIYNTANTIANGIVDAAQGEYTDAVMSTIPYGLSKIPIDKLGSKYLPNAYKYNPYRFKADPKAYYRKIGDEEGLKDLFNSGVLRSKPNGNFVNEQPYFSKGIPMDGGRAGEFKIPAMKNMKYKGKYMVEAKGIPFEDVTGVTGKPINTILKDDSGLNIYQEDWLRGYKPVKKQQFGGSSILSQLNLL